MYIEAVEIENYKCFLDRQTLNFEPGFNLLVGANNAGKTTVLDVMDMQPNLAEPHRSQRTIPSYGGATVGHSSYQVAVAMTFQELRQMVGSNQVLLPVRLPREEDGESLESISTGLLAFALAEEPIHWVVSFEGGVAVSAVSGGDWLFGTADPRQGNTAMHTGLFFYPHPTSDAVLQISNIGEVSTTIAGYYHQFRNRVYRFSAKRQPGTECAGVGTATLDREATSLPYCINHLQTNDAHGHQILCGWVNRIFPSVKWVQSPPIGGGPYQIQCLPLPKEQRRDDLATPLARMGTGIGNVIAMLYVVLTSRHPQVIAIDEPNAFLHPRALRELLAILESEGKQHQFLLTAHSADVLTAVNARTVSLLEFDGVATSVRQVGLKDLHILRGGLAELGIRMTDLHAKDRVLWVEGTTEELVMPTLLRYACPEIAAGTAVLRVERTGTFSRKGVDPQEVAQLYERLSSSSALVPPMICILLDAEMRTPEQRSNLERASRGTIRFLERRMIENYLLDPEAIAATLIELDVPTDPLEVQAAIQIKVGCAGVDVDLTQIDGAAVLTSVFSTLSQARHEFRKTRDVPTLVEHLIAHHPDRLTPLHDFLRQICGLASKHD